MTASGEYGVIVSVAPALVLRHIDEWLARSYDNFWSQSGRRMAGFSDVKFTPPSDAPLYYDTFEAKHITQYLESYVDSHVYHGTTLRSRILFNHRVRKAEKVGSAWTFHIEAYGEKKTVTSDKLVVATGRNSIPRMPALLSQEAFEGLLIHHKTYGQVSRTTLPQSSYKNIAVLGGGKAAADMVYQSAKSGKNVSWIVRRDGEGPACFLPATGSGRYKNSVEQAATRYRAYLSPSSFMPWLPKIFHRTKVALKYMAGVDQGVDQSCRDAAAYETREGALPGFRDLDFDGS